VARRKQGKKKLRSTARRGRSPIDLGQMVVHPTHRKGEVLARRYRIEGLLGSGGTSDVYLVFDPSTETWVVAKQLNPGASQHPELRARFLAEGRGLLELDERGIVRILDCVEAEGERPFLVMELLIGEPLSALLKRQLELPPLTALLIARAAAQGLLAAHDAGIVHRDIKPDNIYLLGPPGEPFGAKIIDFGMAKLPDRNGTSGVHTVLGTVEYMAPEQVMADPVDARTDIYGFGIVLFRLFTGQLPFEADGGIDLLSHQLFSPIPPPSWICETIDPDIETVIVRATRKHPDNRYLSVSELLADLDAIGTSSPPAWRPLLVDPDVYQPQNEKGREVAVLLAERYSTIAPPLFQEGEVSDSGAEAPFDPKAV
jgi:eukaryotic-like serine/threonine-protein kinase